MAHATINFISDALKRPVTITAIFPTDKMVLKNKTIPQRKPFKTLYYLEGACGDYSNSLHSTLIKPMAEDHNLCVVMVGGDNKWYCDSEISGDYYGKLIREDIIKFTRETFNLSTKREDTFIGGFSMGGFGAIVNGLRCPEIFSHIIMLNSALQKPVILSSVDEPGHDRYTRTQYMTLLGVNNVADYIGSEQDYEALAERVAKNKQLMPRVFMSCGIKDGLLDGNKAFRDKLIGLGYDVSFETVPGGHAWTSALNTGLEKAFDWLPLDGFRDNMKQTGEDSNFGWEEYLGWVPKYTTD